MTQAINQYLGAKREHQQCVEWAEMLGKQYYGGNGGFGDLRTIHLATGDSAPTIYYQEHCGAANYHKMPASLALYIEKAIKANFPELLAHALQLKETELQKAANEAVKEHYELLKQAGLTIAGLSV